MGGATSPIPSALPQFSDPATPSYTTPCCTPRRLSLSQVESSTNCRDATRTTCTSLGLVRLLVEQGISASVYDPRSWDRGGPAALGAPLDADAEMEELWEHEGTGEAETQHTVSPLYLPSTPPNSPTRRCRSKSMSSNPPAPPPPQSPGADFQFGPSDEPLFYETFLASRPAQTILKEVLAEFEKEPAVPGSYQSRLQATNLRLVDKLKRFRTLGPQGRSKVAASPLLGPFAPPGLSSTALGGGLGPVLNAGLRRNRSYPAMVGASMAMKDPGGPPGSTDLFLGHALPAHHVANTEAHTQHTDSALLAPAQHPKDLLYMRQTQVAGVTPKEVLYRQPWPDD